METMKTETLPERVSIKNLDRVTNMLKVAAHPQRLAILDLLGKGERLTVSNIQELLGMDQPIASQHLTLMRDRGLVDVEREGKFSYYYLRHPEFIKIIDCLENCCKEE